MFYNVPKNYIQTYRLIKVNITKWQNNVPAYLALIFITNKIVVWLCDKFIWLSHPQPLAETDTLTKWQDTAGLCDRRAKHPVESNDKRDDKIPAGFDYSW